MLSFINILSSYEVVPSILLLLVVLLVCYWYKKPCNFPPGVRGFPLVGVIPYIVSSPEVKLNEWAKTYGNIFSIRMGRKEWLVLNDLKSIKKAFISNASAFSDRPQLPVLNELPGAGNGIVEINYGEKWKVHRRFALSTFRGLGVGTRTIEEKIQEEATYLCNSIRLMHEKPFDINDILTKAVSNNICSVLFGERFSYEDPLIDELTALLKTGFNDPDGAKVIQIVTFAPVLKFLPPFRKGLTKVVDELKSADDYFRNLIDNHKKTFDSNNLRDYIDAFIFEMKQENDNFTDTQLVSFVREVFVAGTETSTITLLWAILCLFHYPESHHKLSEEILKVVGRERCVSYSDDRESMPYTNAFMQEIFRFRTIVPLNVPHQTKNDVYLEGYLIPKGTGVLSNLWAVHNDETVWENPSMFMPERHLNENGEYIHSNRVIPFGLGPRHCLGEQLARMETFMFLVSMVQHFRFQPDPAGPKPPDIHKGSSGITFKPLPFDIVAKER